MADELPPERPMNKRPSGPSGAAEPKGASGIRERTAKAFDTRTQRWQEAGLSGEITRAESRKAIREAILLVLLLIGVMLVFAFRGELFPDAKKVVRFATAGSLILIGWGLARSVAKGVAPALLSRMDPATAGSFGFLIRLFTIVAVIFGSLAIAGVKPETLAVGGAFTAVVLGLAAQQTLGNVIAGAVLLSARPFRVADRIRAQGAGIDAEGTVASLGLFYTVLVSGADRILIPNSVLMSIAVMPLREPDPVVVVARFESAVTPSSLQAALEERISVELARPPQIGLDEIDTDGVKTFRVSATPERSEDGAQLAGEVLEAITAFGGEGDTDPRGEPATEV